MACNSVDLPAPEGTDQQHLFSGLDPADSEPGDRRLVLFGVLPPEACCGNCRPTLGFTVGPGIGNETHFELSKCARRLASALSAPVLARARVASQDSRPATISPETPVAITWKIFIPAVYST